MPAITKDAAIELLRGCLRDFLEIHEDEPSRPAVRCGHEALRDTEHITDTAATQAVEKPQDGLVLPPMRGTDSQQDASLAKLREVATWIDSQCNQQQISPEEFCYPTQFDHDLAQAASELFALAADIEQSSIAGSARAGRNAQPDSTTEAAPTDLSAVEVPQLPKLMRYDMETHDVMGGWSSDTSMIENKEGDWVRYDDLIASMKGNNQ